jgi:CHAD domain-containing protein
VSFAIQPGQPITEEFHRVAGEQFGAAIAGLEGVTDSTVDEVVHDVRKRCKRLRATFRLVGPTLGERRYRRLDVLVRDAARELSGSRDAAALLAMFDDLIKAHAGELSAEVTGAVRAGLDPGGGDGGDESETTTTLRRARERLETGCDAALTSKLRPEGFEALSEGLAKTYHQGRSALKSFRRKGTIELSHEWRKAVKYGWHQIELLEDIAPAVLAPSGEAFHRLADALGDAHNLAVLVDTVEGAPGRFGGGDAVASVAALANASRADLEERAIRLGLRLYAESPAAYTRRLEHYWLAAVESGPELPAGELADLPRG